VTAHFAELVAELDRRGQAHRRSRLTTRQRCRPFMPVAKQGLGGCKGCRRISQVEKYWSAESIADSPAQAGDPPRLSTSARRTPDQATIAAPALHADMGGMKRNHAGATAARSARLKFSGLASPSPIDLQAGSSLIQPGIR